MHAKHTAQQSFCRFAISFLSIQFVLHTEQIWHKYSGTESCFENSRHLCSSTYTNDFEENYNYRTLFVISHYTVNKHTK